MNTENGPFVLSMSKHERRGNAPFDKLRVNGKKYVSSIMDSLVRPYPIHLKMIHLHKDSDQSFVFILSLE
jgi:hypothetical protein